MSLIEVRWRTQDPGALIRRLRERLGFTVEDGGPNAVLSVPSARILIVGEEPSRATPPLTIDGASEEPDVLAVASPRHPNGVVDLLGIGWATVDLGRSGEELGFALASMPADEILGALARRCLPLPGHRPLGPALERIVLLEPATEGRLAASLARHGEGLAALYFALAPQADALELELAVRDWAEQGARSTVIGEGPYGREVAAADGPTWGPHIVLVQPR